MNTKITLAAIFLANLSMAQTVGTPSLGSYNTDNNVLLSTSANQEFPKLIMNGPTKSVVWGEGNGPVSLHHTNLNGSFLGMYDSVIVTETGNQNTQPLHADFTTEFDASTNNYLTVYKHNYYQGANRDFSLKAVLYNNINNTSTPFYIEGPFQYSSEAPGGGFGTNIASNDNGVFCVAYHSSLTNSSTSKVKIKLVDASTGVVSPAASAGAQTGIELTGTGVTNPPSIAWNETAGVFGITYTTGSGNARKIKFVSVDVNGNIVTAAKDLIADASIETQYPRIYADGANFVMVWRDFRTFQIQPFPPVNGTPAIRIAQITPTGDLIDLSGTAELFEENDESLILSNPYQNEIGLHFDLVVITPGQEYAITWTTQTSPQITQLSYVKVTGSTIESTIPLTVNQSGLNSDAPTIGYDNATSKVIIAYTEHNGSDYENRIITGEKTASTTSLEEIEEDALIAYPNPSNGLIQLNKKVNTIKVISFDGRLVASYDNTKQLNLTHLQTGSYILQIDEFKAIVISLNP